MESNKEQTIKVYVEKGSVLYKKLEELAKKYLVPDAVKFVDANGFQIHVLDEYLIDKGNIKVEKIGNEKQICIEWPENKKDKTLNLVWYANGSEEYLLKDIKFSNLGQYTGSIIANVNNAEKSCKISCRTAPGKEPSIRIQFPDGNKVTFYQDGWCNGKNDAEINVDRNMPIKTTPGEYTIYKVGQGDDAVEISYRHTGNKSIRITNKNGDGICVYPDLYVNPVKNGQTRKGDKKINCNLFEFIENNFFRVGYDTNKSFLKKPLGNGMQNQFHSMIQPCQFPGNINNPFNNQHSNTIIQHAPNSNTLYSLEEKNEFTINL